MYACVYTALVSSKSSGCAVSGYDLSALNVPMVGALGVGIIKLSSGKSIPVSLNRSESALQVPRRSIYNPYNSG